jgi:hypothetical protein
MSFIIRWLSGAAGPWLLGFVALLVIGMGATILGLRLDLAHQQNTYAQHLLADEKAAREAVERSRKFEHDYAKAVARAESKHQQELEHEKHEAARIIAALHDGTIQLRQRFRACWNNLSKATAGAGGGDAAAQSGLQTADVEFLIRIAAEADEITKQLQLAQAVVVQDRRTCRGAP